MRDYLTETEERCLKLLCGLTCRPRASRIGELLWPGSVHSGSAPMARPAGRILRQLEQLGLAQEIKASVVIAGHYDWWW